jgi:hypothetical protein
MGDDSDIENNRYLGVIARSLAFLCLANADLRDKDLAAQAAFLEGLGLSRKECALLLQSSENSIAVVLSRENRRARRGTKKTAKRRAKR